MQLTKSLFRILRRFYHSSSLVHQSCWLRLQVDANNCGGVRGVCSEFHTHRPLELRGTVRTLMVFALRLRYHMQVNRKQSNMHPLQGSRIPKVSELWLEPVRWQSRLQLCSTLGFLVETSSVFGLWRRSRRTTGSSISNTPIYADPRPLVPTHAIKGNQSPHFQTINSCRMLN